MGNDDYRSDSGDSVSTRLTYLLIGGGIGAVIALLFAPKSGQELRGDLADATRKGIDRSREAAQQLGDKAGEYYESTRERAGELYTQASTKASDIYSQASERVGEVAQTAREAATRRRSDDQGDKRCGPGLAVLQPDLRTCRRAAHAGR